MGLLSHKNHDHHNEKHHPNISNHVHSSNKRGRSYTPEEEHKLAAKFLSKAENMVKEVDNSYIVTHRNHKLRPLPHFHMNEISLGKELGSGGFGIVYEINEFHKWVPPKTTTEDSISNDIQDALETTAEGSSTDSIEKPLDDIEKANKINVSSDMNSSLCSHMFCDLIRHDHDDHTHYELDKAKLWMRKRPNRREYPRYALKRLKDNLTELELARGIVDLAIEAKFLSIVFHPNIIKIRGISDGDMINADFFIILDRLYLTLDQQIIKWSESATKYHGKCMGLIGRNKQGLEELMIERMTVAYDLAGVFDYLHSNKLVYRDIKPENIGFDFRRDVKLFDFGLCKSLNVKLKARNLEYGYRLTGRVGSFPYMAPEVVLMKTYDSKCDVFSYAILLWEILSLKQAFQGMDGNTFVNKVIVEQQRLGINKKWPSLTRAMLPEAWEDNPRRRPDMKRISTLIRGDLNLMTSDESVLRRTEHLQAQSDHSDVSDDAEEVRQ